MKTFESFLRQTETHQISLPSQIIEAASDPALLGKFCFAPTDMLAAVAAAGHMLRRNPGEPLIDRPLPRNIYTKADAPRRILANMLDASLHPVVDTDTPSFSYAAEVPTISACGSTDWYFGIVFNALADPKRYRQMDVQLITHEGKPLFVRKTALGHSSAINVKKIVLNGIPIPENTVLRVDTTYDTPNEPLSVHQRERQPDLPPDELMGNKVANGQTTRDVSCVTAVGFARLSALALPPKQRTPHMFPGANQEGEHAAATREFLYKSTPWRAARTYHALLQETPSS